MTQPVAQDVPATDASNDILAPRQRQLDVFFAPTSVAVVGATETAGSVGRTVLWNLISNPFGGVVFPVNPKRASVLGVKAYPSISALPQQVDLAVIVTPAQSVPGVVKECVANGVKGAIIISAGFKERGAEGIALEEEILATARAGNMRLIGPNCLGVMSPLSGLNATFAGGMALKGNVGFISQSGALCTSVLDWSLREHVGFSAFLSLGSMLDVGWGELIDRLGDDPNTRSIIIYMESIGNARSFLSAAREVARTKPIIVIKAGRTEVAAKAAASHTGTLAGSDDVLDAAFRRVGVLRVNNLAEVFSMAEVLAKQPSPRGPRLTIVTNAGGPGVLATDALIAKGGELAPLSPETLATLNAALPEHWSHGNPVDILGDGDSERYAKAVEVALNDPTTDGLLVVLTPQAMTEPRETAELLRPYGNNPPKPVLASWMGGDAVAPGDAILNEAGIPTFPYPDTAARAFHYMWEYTDNLRLLYETPALLDGADGELFDRATATAIIQEVRATGRTILTEYESKRLLAAYGIPTVETHLANSPDEAVARADALGYPVVLKLNSLTITHKTDVGGIQLNLRTAADVRAAYQRIEQTVAERAGAGHFQGVTVQPMVKLEGYELILGSSLDVQFGPVLLFGTGGQLVEVFKDRAIGLPPLNSTLARRMMEQTRIFEALKGVRGRAPVDIAELEQLLVRFSQLVLEQPWIKELDINPLLASPESLIALDGRVILHDPEVAEEDLPRPAIRPYPRQYRKEIAMRDGSPAVVRPIRPEDEPYLVKFHETLSNRSVHLRYFNTINLSERIAHERLTRICFVDYDREITVVALRRLPPENLPEIMAVGRLRKLDQERAEFTLLVSDRFQRRGLGHAVLSQLIEIGRAEGLKLIYGDTLPENYEMHKLCQSLGFQLQRDAENEVVRATIRV